MKAAIAIILLVALLAGCGEVGNQLQIRGKRSDYESWIATNRPYLAAVPSTSVYEVEFSTSKDTKGVIRPTLDYYYKAGDWDGIINVTLTFDIDSAAGITGIKEERLTFIAFPASAPYPSSSDRGRLRHSYSGLKLEPKQTPDLLARVAKGEDFDDLRERSRLENQTVLDCFVDTDKRKSLRPVAENGP